jgi:hypothetical protein
MIKIDRDRFLDEGFLILCNVIPPKILEELRTSYEILLDRQREIWRRERKPEDPPGGHWETSMQPRLTLQNMADLLDEKTINTVEFWLHENTLGVSRELLATPDPGVTAMLLMCNPATDRGPAEWHRDIRPSDSAPLQGYIDDILENGPRYVQWNIPLYDDEVLWVIPGSHRRLNTPEEDRLMLENPKIPIPGGVQAHLKAGDAVPYILPITHWGSNYSAKMRRTIHGGYHNHTMFANLDFTRHLAPESKAKFERWDRRSKQMQDHTEAALRSVMNRDAEGYRTALERIHPGRGEQGQRLTTVFLCKAAQYIYILKHPGFEPPAESLKISAEMGHALTLNWGPKFAERFSVEESEDLWERFRDMDASLQNRQEGYIPGFQSGPSPYLFNEMPDDLSVESLMAERAAR